MSDDPSESPSPAPDPDPRHSKPPDMSAFVPKIDLSAFVPKIDVSAFVPKIDMSGLFPKPIDVSAFLPKIDMSAFFPKADLSVLFPGVYSSRLFPVLDASALFPTVNLRSLVAQVDASTLSRVADWDGSAEVSAEHQPTVLSRQVAAALTAFVFFIVFIGLAILVQDYSQIARISQITGANPFEIAMGFGALTFWVAYSRRRP